MTANAPQVPQRPSAPSEPERPPAAHQNAFVAYAARWRAAINEAVEKSLATLSNSELTNPELKAYLYEPARQFVAGGKRLRPALALLGCEVAGGAPHSALSCAAALECFQAAALIHDDIADHATQRRGQPALQRRYGVGLAINTGDLALVESFGALINAQELAPATRLELLGELGAMMVKTVEGQALDVGWARHKRWDITPARYLAMAELKTAHYSVATPLVLGALIAGAPAALVKTLRQGGLKAGLAFQITDDVLDLTGTLQTLGKAPLGDITEGKRTLVVALALERLDAQARLELIDILNAKTHEEAPKRRAVELMEHCGALEEAKRTARRLAHEASRAFASLELGSGPPARALLALPAFTCERVA